MAENRNVYIIKEDESSSVRIADELISVIAALAATEVDGVASMAGNITKDIVKAVGIKNLAQGVTAQVNDNDIIFSISLNVDYGRSISEVGREVQERVKNAVETMTGMNVKEVRINIADVDLQSSK